MQLILTHEQADLDALASMHGAKLLVPEAFALLPRQINRNGREFIKRYGDELSFSTIQDLPNRSIEQVHLVDTQSMVTLRGLTNQTKVSVIDHHPRKVQTNTDWQLQLENTGACTTLLVEKIQAEGLELESLSATLLLMGIYEDTGSLSYSNTKARDAKAVAFLLERGADLNIVSHYLNPPLSNLQQQLYDRLLKNLSTHTIEGFTILLAHAEAFDLNDEISSVAHKLREFLDPDGMVLIVTTRQGVRMVARSTVDNLDMARLARHFNGGGHKRASSALIRPADKPTPENTRLLMDDTIQETLQFLPSIVTPELQVRHIMSRDPLVLSPEMSMQESARLMSRYGYEGYPVVQDGQLIGLLNRRNVDRALQHNLEKTVGDLMEAGQVSVSPNDPISRLKDVMFSSGWGQIPVADPNSGKIIAIVTRTDLISTLNSTSGPLPQADMVAALEQALTQDRKKLLLAVAEQAKLQQLPAYIVGGFVRDLLLKKFSQDFDIVVEGDAIEFAQHLVQAYGGRVVIHRRFGTAKWILADHKAEIITKIGIADAIEEANLPDHLDLISARTEYYDRPAALPVVERSSIKMDLHRRDFTINTLALRLDGDYFGQLFDFWGGYDDLQEGQIRVLHALSFVDDATRMLRAVRFAERFDFKIEARTLSLLQASLPLLDELSGARIQHEFDMIFQESKVPEIMLTLQDLGILASIHPDLGWDTTRHHRIQCAILRFEESLLSLEELKKILWYLWLEVYPSNVMREISTRLRLSAKRISMINQTAQLRSLIPAIQKMRPSQVTETLASFPSLVIRTLLLSCDQESDLSALQNYLDHYRTIKVYTTGADLKARGIPPSPRYDQILTSLKNAWLDGEVNNYEEEIELLEKLLLKE